MILFFFFIDYFIYRLFSPLLQETREKLQIFFLFYCRVNNFNLEWFTNSFELKTGKASMYSFLSYIKGRHLLEKLT